MIKRAYGIAGTLDALDLVRDDEGEDDVVRRQMQPFITGGTLVMLTMTYLTSDLESRGAMTAAIS